MTIRSTFICGFPGETEEDESAQTGEGDVNGPADDEQGNTEETGAGETPAAAASGTRPSAKGWSSPSGRWAATRWSRSPLTRSAPKRSWPILPSWKRYKAF